MFNGKELDEETGLVYYGARYYNPRESVWLSVDPPMLRGEYLGEKPTKLLNNGVFNPKNLGVYSYAWNSPVVLRDPDGNAVTPETVWDVINVAMGVASLAGNIATGNVAGAAADIAGLLYDATAAAVPVLPAGASTAIGAYRLVKLAKRSKSLLTSSARILAKYAPKVAEKANRLKKSANALSGKGALDDMLGAVKEKLGIVLESPKPGGSPTGHVEKLEGTINSLKKSYKEIGHVLKDSKSGLSKVEKGVLKETQRTIKSLSSKYEKVLKAADDFLK